MTSWHFVRFLFLLSSLLLTSCGPRFLGVKTSVERTQYIEKIDAYNQEINQLKASLSVSVSGLIGSTHQEADILLRTPHYFYWSLRSFFGPSSMILATNGQYLTMLDWTDDQNEPYLIKPLNNQTVFELFGFRFHPQSLINMILAKIPIHNSTNIELKHTDEKVQITASLSDGSNLRSVFDHRLGRVLETKLLNHTLGFSYHATYDNFKEIEGRYFPHTIVIVAKNSIRTVKINLSFQSLELNGEAIRPDVFYLSPH